jgi:hypothetical protein
VISPHRQLVFSTFLSLSKTVQVHILTRNRIFEATLAVSNKQEYEKQSTTISPSLNDSNPTVCPTLSIPTSLFSQEMADFLSCPMNLPAPSDSVRLIMIIVKLNMNP